MIDKGEALRRLHGHAGQFDADARTVERIAGAVAASGVTGPAGELRVLLAAFVDEQDHDGRDLTALLLADVAGTAALPALLMACDRDLGDVSWDLRELIDGLVRHGDGARGELLGMIAGGSPRECRAALQWFEPVARAEDVPLLATTATHPDPAIRALVARQLPGPAGDDRAFEVLIAILRDADPEVRIAAVRRLAEIRRRDAGGPLAALAGDPEPRVRARVAYALGRLGDPAAQPVLRDLLRDTDERVRGRAGEALGRIGGDPAIDALLTESGAADPRQRVRAAKALAQVVDDPRAEERLRALAADGDAAVRAAVLSGLATAGDITGRWTSLVADLTADGDVTVRHRVVGTVAHLHPYPDQVLKILAADPSGFVREAAVEALEARRHLRR
ncbi:HEAT repeat domain-containing protein [Actinoplanes sp. NPDC023801]|uniref:HEAT repeat domain-containing protein n=1 Tax=Actinoplanes sp. NPDC023801 TaxID=3154595 RepID=UPI0033DE1D5E